MRRFGGLILIDSLVADSTISRNEIATDYHELGARSKWRRREKDSQEKKI